MGARTLGIEFRYAEGRYDRLPALADKLVRANVELIAPGPSLAAVAMRKATSTIPVVMLVVGDPVGLGLVASLARPGSLLSRADVVVRQPLSRNSCAAGSDPAQLLRRV